MKRITNIDFETNCKKFETALERFMKKYPGHEEWKETFAWMFETKTDFFCDNIMGDGSRNDNWCYALHLDILENGFYMALVERA